MGTGWARHEDWPLVVLTPCYLVMRCITHLHVVADEADEEPPLPFHHLGRPHLQRQAVLFEHRPDLALRFFLFCCVVHRQR